MTSKSKNKEEIVLYNEKVSQIALIKAVEWLRTHNEAYFNIIALGRRPRAYGKIHPHVHT
jgi:hypothetical protein